MGFGGCQTESMGGGGVAAMCSGVVLVDCGLDGAGLVAAEGTGVGGEGGRVDGGVRSDGPVSAHGSLIGCLVWCSAGFWMSVSLVRGWCWSLVARWLCAQGRSCGAWFSHRCGVLCARRRRRIPSVSCSSISTSGVMLVLSCPRLWRWVSLSWRSGVVLFGTAARGGGLGCFGGSRWC